jgi:hypothetical protein
MGEESKKKKLGLPPAPAPAQTRPGYECFARFNAS